MNPAVSNSLIAVLFLPILLGIPSLATAVEIRDGSSFKRAILVEGDHEQSVDWERNYLRPRSASHTSPGRGLIELVQHLLLDGTRAYQIERVIIRRIDHFGYQRPDFLGDLGLPFPQFYVELLGDGVHAWRVYLACRRSAISRNIEPGDERTLKALTRSFPLTAVRPSRLCRGFPVRSIRSR